MHVKYVPHFTVVVTAVMAVIATLSIMGAASAQSHMPAYERPGALACSSKCVGDPINTGSGNLYEEYVDYSSKGPYPLVFYRAYNNMVAEENLSPDGAFENLGRGWSTNVDRHLFITMNPLPPGKTQVGPCMIQGQAYMCPPADPTSNRPYVIGITLWRKDGGQGIFYYDGLGKPAIGTKFNSERGTSGELQITSVSAANRVTGYLYTCVGGDEDPTCTDGEREAYDGTGRLLYTEDEKGLRQSYQYDAAGALVSVTDPFGRKLRFAYDSQRRLQTLTDPAGGTITYAYDSIGNLATVTFQDQTQTRYIYEDVANPHSLTGVIDQDGNRYVTWQFDQQGRAISSTLADGIDQVRVIYNPGGSADVIEPERPDRHLTFTSINGKQMMTTSSAPCQNCNVKAITYDKNGFIDSETDFQGNTTQYSHDAAGREISSSPQDADTESPPLPGYDAHGLLVSLTYPDGSKTGFSYDSQGNVSAIKDSKGRVVRFPRYDAHGNPLSIIDEHGVETTLVYDPEQHLISRTAAGRKTEYRYDGAGQLTKVIVPGGAYVEYEYIAAHRLTNIKDSLGDTISFTLNGHGWPIGEHVFNNAQPNLTPKQIIDQMDSLIRPKNN